MKKIKKTKLNNMEENKKEIVRQANVKRAKLKILKNIRREYADSKRKKSTVEFFLCVRESLRV